MAIEFGNEFIRRRLARVLRHDDAVHVQPQPAHLVDEAQNVRAVRDTEIRADLVAFQILRGDHENDLRLLFEREQDFALCVAFKSGKNAAGVHIVKQLPSEFEIQLVVKLLDAFQNLFTLQSDIQFVVKSLFHS